MLSAHTWASRTEVRPRVYATGDKTEELISNDDSPDITYGGVIVTRETTSSVPPLFLFRSLVNRTLFNFSLLFRYLGRLGLTTWGISVADLSFLFVLLEGQ
ncbi:hypothetical protein Pfo_019668 [Paulownia fortunei]|nr:hypothetical protein Pfo_019668 [Paulownia fortunei]